MEKRESSYTVVGNVNWCSYCGQQYMEVPQKKQNIKLLYGPAILLLGIYPKINMIQKDTCTPTLTTTLFTIAKTWKQPKCPLTDEWVKMKWLR